MHSQQDPLPRRRQHRWWTPQLVDRTFLRTVLLAGLTVIVVCVAIGVILWLKARPAFSAYGWSLLWRIDWDPIKKSYGALPFIYGTIATSLIAIAIALPLSLGTAIILAEIAPPWVRNPLSFAVEMLAAIPSIVYGIWGLFVLVPALRPLQTWLQDHFGYLPFFTGTPFGLGLMAASLVLAVMIVPIITALTREVLSAVPQSVRDAAYAVGATRWETIRGPVFEYGRAGIAGAVLLALARALGETMAVTMVIGNKPQLSISLLEPAYTMASLLANEFSEAFDPLYVAVLMSIAWLLFLLTVAVNAAARLLLWSVVKHGAPAEME